MKFLAFTVFLLGGIASAQVKPGYTPEPGPNLPIQKIGQSDLIAVSVYDAPELTRTIRVTSEGMIRLPMLKQPLRAEGLLPSELEAVIADALKDEQLIVDPYVTVTVGEYHSHPISVMGAVKKPLTFQAEGEVTLLDALARAEGLAQDAGNEILLTRPAANGQNALTRRIPVRTLIDDADPSANVKLTGGEEIRVPEAGKVFVLGNVKKPGAFVVKYDADATVLKALADAEGLMPYASKQAYIYRREASGSKQEIPIELSKIMQRKASDVPLMANDILYIPDAKGTRATLSAIEKALIFGTGISSALIYTTVK